MEVGDRATKSDAATSLPSLIPSSPSPSTLNAAAAAANLNPLLAGKPSSTPSQQPTATTNPPQLDLSAMMQTQALMSKLMMEQLQLGSGLNSQVGSRQADKQNIVVNLNEPTIN